MATYYVSPDGDDSANGTTSLTPVKTLGHAYALMSAADSLEILDTSTLSPLRYKRETSATGATVLGLPVTAAITIGNSTHQYYSTATDISEGVSRGEFLSNPDMDAWTDATTIFDYDEVVAKPLARSTTVDTGFTYSAKLGDGADGSFMGITYKVFLPTGATYQVIATMRSENGGNQANLKITDNTASESYNFSTDLWDAGNPTNNFGTPGAQTFDTITDSFTTQNSSEHNIQCGNDGGATNVGYLQQISLTCTSHPTYSWTPESTSNVYSLPVVHITPKRILYTTNDDWNANGVNGFQSALANLKVQTSEANMNSTESSFYWNSTTRKLYIHLPSGVSILDAHLELLAASPSDSALNFTADCTVYNLTTALSSGVTTNAGCTVGLIGENFNSINNIDNSFKLNDGTGNDLTYCKAEWNRGDWGVSTAGDAFVAVNAGVALTCTGCLAKNILDDGFEGASGGDITTYGCLVDTNGTEGETAAIGFKVVDDGDANFQYSTAINCVAAGFKNENTGVSNFTIEYCIGKDNGTDFNLNTSGPTFTINNNIGKAIADANSEWSGGTGNHTLSNANIKLNPDGSLQSDFTEAVGTGVKWWGTAKRPISSNGKSYPDFDIDTGGIQSTYSLHDPSNL